MKLRLNTNYSTNEELIKQCMLLDDNDEVDSEKERQKWFERQNERKQKHRRIQLAKQRESEEYEAKRFEAMQKAKMGIPNTTLSWTRRKRNLITKNKDRLKKWKNLTITTVTRLQELKMLNLVT